MKKVLLVGENSYIGNEFVRYQSQNFIVEKISARDDTWKQCDFSQYDTILHLAAIVHLGRKVPHKQYHKINTALPIAVAQKAKKEGVSQFIFMSTAAIYGSHAAEINQNTTPNPDTIYGKTKLDAENELLKFQNAHFNIVIVRPPMVYGPNCPGNFTKLVKLTKFTLIFPEIINRRSMIYIENLCEFLRLIINANAKGIYHPQNREYTCTSNMVHLIAKQIHKRIVFTKIFNPLIRILLNRVSYLIKIFGDNYYDMNIDDSKNILGKYAYIDFEESIRQSII